MKDFSEFFLMNTEDAKRYAVEVLHRFEPDEETECVEIGDGNINYVFKIWSRRDGHSVIVKQADRLLRSSGRPLDIYRNKIEAAILQLEGELAPGYVPEVYYYDETMSATSMEDVIAYAMQHEGIDLFTSAADSIARDGHIANKIGTFQIAILAKYFGIPYYVTGIPDRDKLTKDDIVIEMRDPEQVLRYRGIPNCLPQVKAIYPSFDIVPPHLISGAVTDKGVYVPYLLNRYFDSEVKAFY